MDMSQNAPGLTTAAYYPALLDRLAHVENLRHGIMTVQLAIAGALLGQFFNKDGVEIFRRWEACVPAVLMVAATLKLLEMMAHNLFGRSIRAATEMMIIEYADGLVTRGIGYFAFRRQRTRAEYWMSGMAPELLLLFFVIAFTVLSIQVPYMKWFGCALILACYFSMLFRYRAVGRVFARKDLLEAECEKDGAGPLAKRLYELRTGN
jgi:hypothetical protein